MVLVLARTSGSTPGKELWFWFYPTVVFYVAPRQLANKDRNELISYNKTSIERIDMGMIAKN